MKLTPEQLAELKTLKMPDWLARKDDVWAHEADQAIPALIADLEEAKEQLASPFMDGYEAAKAEYRPQIIAAEAELAATRKLLAYTQEALLAERNRREYFLERANGIGCDSLTDVFKMVSSLRRKLAEAQARIEAARKVTVLGSSFIEREAYNILTGQDTSALDAAIAEAIEPYRKDAACWRFARKNLLWREVGDDHIRWSMELAMPEPDLECGILSNDSVARALDAAVLAAIAAKGESE